MLWRLLEAMESKLMIIDAGDAAAYLPVGRVTMEPPRLELCGCYDLEPDDRVGVIFTDAAETTIVVVGAVVERVVSGRALRLRCLDAVIPDASGSPEHMSVP